MFATNPECQGHVVDNESLGILADKDCDPTKTGNDDNNMSCLTLSPTQKRKFSTCVLGCLNCHWRNCNTLLIW